MCHDTCHGRGDLSLVTVRLWAGGVALVRVSTKITNEAKREETRGVNEHTRAAHCGSCQRHISGRDGCGSVVEDTLLFSSEHSRRQHRDGSTATQGRGEAATQSRGAARGWQVWAHCHLLNGPSNRSATCWETVCWSILHQEEENLISKCSLLGGQRCGE